jgi:2-amino-4-hydroxy-6-hydroxymethyldihydropteridine diphosphokinase
MALPSSSQAFVALGSNLSFIASDKTLAPPDVLRAALAQLEELAFCDCKRSSGIYQSKPWRSANSIEQDSQPDYFNAVVQLKTELAPRALLACLLDIERDFGRIRSAAQAQTARTLDLDLLLCGPTPMQSVDLILPHPRMHLRAFVLGPLLEIAPDLHLPMAKGAQSAANFWQELPAMEREQLQRVAALR